jgi:hypothetical protein
MIRSWGRTSSTLVLLVGLGAMSNRADAGDFAWGAGYIGEYTTNATLSRANQIHDWINTGLLGFGYRELTGDVQAFVQATAEYRNYARGTYPDYTTGIADAFGIWHVAPGQFAWLAEDTYRQLQRTATATATPDNFTNVNVISTGPDVLLRFTPVSALQIGGRVGSVNERGGDADNVNFGYYGRLLYVTSPTTVLSLNFEQLSVNMANDVAYTDYTRYDAFFAISQNTPTSAFSLDLGRTLLQRERGDDLVGNRGRLFWNRQATIETGYGLAARAGYGDSGTDLLGASRFFTGAPTSADLLLTSRRTAPPSTLSTLALTGGPTGTISGDIYFDKRVDVYVYSGYAGATTVGTGLRGFWQKLDYETTPNDRTEYGGYAEVFRPFYYQLIGTLFANGRRIEFTDIARDDTEWQAGVRLQFRYSADVLIFLEGRHTERSSSDPAFEYKETRGLISISYSTAPFYNPMLTR